jgi:predicted translin family RNA/ssDNA-binding protein
MRGEMSAADEKRETVIKRSRDVQKLSKQAIFSLHRGNDKEADERIRSAKKTAEELLPLIAECPTLRPGSFANAGQRRCTPPPAGSAAPGRVGSSRCRCAPHPPTHWVFSP